MVLVAGRYIITECWHVISFKSMRKSTTCRRGVLQHAPSVLNRANGSLVSWEVRGRRITWIRKGATHKPIAWPE